MSLYSIARNLAVLGVNVVEAVVYSVFNFDRQADQLWSETSSVADPSPEAADEHRGGSIPNQNVEPPRLPTLHPACLFVAEAAVREMAKTPGAMGYGPHFLREVADELHTIYETVK